MDPTTLRLQENTLEELDEEFEEFGFDDRASYLRYIIKNRAVVMEENTPEQVSPIRDRMDELEQRLLAVEEGETTENTTTTTTEDTETTTTEDTETTDGESLLAFEEDTEETTETTDELLPEDYPGRNVENPNLKRNVGVAAVRWLVDRDYPGNKTDFLEEFYEDHAPGTQNKNTFWKTVVRPALQESPVVEYSHGNHEYSATVE